jgi:hypothetical protein
MRCFDLAFGLRSAIHHGKKKKKMKALQFNFSRQFCRDWTPLCEAKPIPTHFNN